MCPQRRVNGVCFQSNKWVFCENHQISPGNYGPLVTVMSKMCFKEIVCGCGPTQTDPTSALTVTLEKAQILSQFLMAQR